MDSPETHLGTVHLIHVEGHVNPGVIADESITGSVRIDEHGWVHVAREGRPPVSFPPHAVARIDWERSAP